MRFLTLLWTFILKDKFHSGPSHFPVNKYYHFNNQCTIIHFNKQCFFLKVQLSIRIGGSRFSQMEGLIPNGRRGCQPIFRQILPKLHQNEENGVEILVSKLKINLSGSKIISRSTDHAMDKCYDFDSVLLAF